MSWYQNIAMFLGFGDGLLNSAGEPVASRWIVSCTDLPRRGALSRVVVRSRQFFKWCTVVAVCLASRVSEQTLPSLIVVLHKHGNQHEGTSVIVLMLEDLWLTCIRKLWVR